MGQTHIRTALCCHFTYQTFLLCTFLLGCISEHEILNKIFGQDLLVQKEISLDIYQKIGIYTTHVCVSV